MKYKILIFLMALFISCNINKPNSDRAFVQYAPTIIIQPDTMEINRNFNIKVSFIVGNGCDRPGNVNVIENGNNIEVRSYLDDYIGNGPCTDMMGYGLQRGDLVLSQEINKNIIYMGNNDTIYRTIPIQIISRKDSYLFKWRVQYFGPNSSINNRKIKLRIYDKIFSEFDSANTIYGLTDSLGKWEYILNNNDDTLYYSVEDTSSSFISGILNSIEIIKGISEIIEIQIH